MKLLRSSSTKERSFVSTEATPTTSATRRETLNLEPPLLDPKGSKSTLNPGSRSRQPALTSTFGANQTLNPGDFEPGFEPGSKRDFKPLGELSLLLGVWVTDVQHVRVIVNGNPQPDLNAWRLHLPTAEYGLDGEGQ